MGRIKRIGTDTTVNYTLEQTSAYDETRPAATQASWGTTDDVEAMDQSLEATTGELAREGALLTFARIPDRFEGVHVKIRPTYDSDAGEAPTLELWTHKQNAGTWTRRRAIQLGGIVGVESGRAKVFQLDLAVSLTKVDAVWVTMNPGPTGSPTMRFLAIHAFGRCNESLQTPGDCDDGTADPSVDCSGPSACEVNPFDPSCIVPALTCADLGYEEDADGNCIIPGGTSFPNDPTGNQPVPRFEPPVFPTIDLCDPAAVEAFKQLLTPEQLAYFEDLLEQVELPCLDPDAEPRQPQQVLPINQDDNGDPIVPAQPPEVYVDPHTLEPADDPRAADDEPDGDEDARIRKSYRFILVWSGNDEAAAQSLVDANVDPLPDDEDPATVATGHYGPASGVSTLGAQFTPACYGLVVRLNDLPYVCRIGLRVQVLRMRGSVDLRNSISRDGIASQAAVGDCPEGPDWVLDASSTLGLVELTQNRQINGDYREFYHRGPSFVNNETTDATLTLTVPRTDSTQNDALTCSPGYSARSRLAFQRGGCLQGLTVKERDRWLSDNSIEDYDDDPTGLPFPTYYAGGRRPMCFVVDVIVRAQLAGGAKYDVRNVSVTLDTTTLRDTQPVEDCS